MRASSALCIVPLAATLPLLQVADAVGVRSAAPPLVLVALPLTDFPQVGERGHVVGGMLVRALDERNHLVLVLLDLDES